MINRVTKQGETRLRKYREKHSLTQWGLCKIANVSVATISAIEMNGLYPTPPVREKLATALGVSEIDIWPELGLGDKLP